MEPLMDGRPPLVFANLLSTRDVRDMRLELPKGRLVDGALLAREALHV
jgi:hypothetical protein